MRKAGLQREVMGEATDAMPIRGCAKGTFSCSLYSLSYREGSNSSDCFIALQVQTLPLWECHRVGRALLGQLHSLGLQ